MNVHNVSFLSIIVDFYLSFLFLFLFFCFLVSCSLGFLFLIFRALFSLQSRFVSTACFEILYFFFCFFFFLSFFF